MGFFHITFTSEGLIVGLSAQRRLPAGMSRSSPAGIPAGIPAECWCHLVRAGEVAGIFLRAALFSWELPCGARSIIYHLQCGSRRVSPPGWPLPLLPCSGSTGTGTGRSTGEQPQAPGMAGQAAKPEHFWLFTTSTTAK